MRKHLALAVAAAMFLFFGTGPALAGWVVEEESDGERTTTYFQDDKIREEASDQIAIIDVAKETMTLINPADKTYWSGSFTDIKQMMGQMAKMMEEQMKNLPPEQKKAMQEALGRSGKSGPPPPVEIKDTGEKETIAGMSALKHQVRVGGKLREEVWVASEAAVHKEIDSAKVAKLTQAFGQDDPETAYESSPEYLQLWAKGYPVKRITYLFGQPDTQVVTAISRQDVPASMFEVPAGYQSVGLEELIQ